MKIAILIDHFPPKWIAGTELLTYNIAKKLSAKGHNVHVITAMDPGLLKENVEEGFTVHRINVPQIRILGYMVRCGEMFFVLNKLNPDVIHCQGSTVGMPALFSKIFLKKPYIVSLHGSDIYSDWKFKKKITKLVLNNANGITALTYHMKGVIAKYSNKEVNIIPNGIDLDRFTNSSKTKCGLKIRKYNNEKVIIFVGTLRPVKGIKYLIQAMRILCNADDSARLILVGDGPDRIDLETMSKELNLGENICFVGAIPNEKVAEYMMSADIFVLPSLSEGFPVVILEAMACGLPIVTTKIKGLPEIIKEGENGFTVKPASSEQLAEKLLLLLHDDVGRQCISENNRIKSQDYSISSVVEKLEQVYSKAIYKLPNHH